MSGHYHINADDLSVTFTGEDGTPTRPDLSHLLFTTMHGPSSSGTPVATPPRQDNHPQHLNMGDIPASSQSGTPVAAPTRKENQPQMPNIDNCSGTSMTHIPVAISIRKELPSQMVNKNDLPVQAGPGMPVRTLTRQDPSRQILPTGVLPSLSFGMGASTLSSDTPVTPARVRQGTPHPSLHPDLFNMTELLDQEGSGAPVTAPMRQETAPQKPTKVPSARKVLTPAKPKSAVPKPVKPKAQKPETANSKTQMSEIANPKTLKRRPSSSHPKTPKAKMVKTEAAMPTTVQNCSLNADTTALGQNSTPERIETASDQLSTPHGIANLSLGQLPTARSTLFQQPITRWTLASPTGANLSLSQSSPLGQPFAQQTRAQQAVFHPGSNGIANSPAQSFRAQEPTVQQPAAQQAIVPTIPPAQPNGYPNFADGDVMIISPTGKTWKLHSTILINASSSLKNILAKLDPVHITKKNREDGVTIRWKLVMIEEPDAEKEDPDGLKFKSFKAVAVYAKPSFSSFSMFRNINGLAGEPQFDKIYDNFFKCLYNINPAFASNRNDSQYQEYITDAFILIEAANYLDAVPAVRVAVEANLLRLNQVLWNHLCSRPESWIHLAARLQSPLIFRETILHIVGRFHLKGGINEAMLMDDKHGELGRAIWELILRKAKELKDKKLRIERHLLEYFPERMLHKEGETTVPGRAIYSEDIYCWQSLMIFRQYCSSACLANYHHRATDAGITFYRSIASGQYLRRGTLDSFFACFSMSKKGKDKLYENLELIKNDMKPLVKELLVDRTQGSLGRNAAPLDHLTCVEILEEEFPWYVTPVVEQSGDVGMSGAL